MKEYNCKILTEETCHGKILLPSKSGNNFEEMAYNE